MSERYGFRKLTPTTLAKEYTLNRCDDRDKNSRAVLNLLEMLELDAVGFGMSELKHCLGLQIEPEIYSPATATHTTYLIAPGSDCHIKCLIDSTVQQPPLFEQSAVLITRIKLHPDSKPFHAKTGPGGGKPFSITIKEEGKADVVLQATSLTDGKKELEKKGINVSRKPMDSRLSGKVTSDFVRDGKTIKFAYTEVHVPKKEDLEQEMYLVLPFTNEKLLEALPGLVVTAAARTAFLDLDALRADPLRFFADMGDDGLLSDDEKKIVARGFVTKDELKDAVWPYLTSYKTRMNAQRDRVLASTDFIKDHVASTQLAEDAEALESRVAAEMAWLYDAAEIWEDAYAAAQAVKAALAAQRKADEASDEAEPRPKRRKVVVPPEPDSSDSESDSDDDAPWHTLPEAVRMRAELEARLADLDDPFVGHEDFIQL